MTNLRFNSLFPSLSTPQAELLEQVCPESGFGMFIPERNQ